MVTKVLGQSEKRRFVLQVEAIVEDPLKLKKKKILKISSASFHLAISWITNLYVFSKANHSRMFSSCISLF